MNCKKCGRELRIGAKKCPYCGSLVPVPGSGASGEFKWNLQKTTSPKASQSTVKTKPVVKEQPAVKNKKLTWDSETLASANSNHQKISGASAKKKTWKEPEEAHQLFSFDIKHETLQKEIDQRVEQIAADQPAPAMERERTEDLFVLPAEMTMEDFSDLLNDSSTGASGDAAEVEYGDTISTLSGQGKKIDFVVEPVGFISEDEFQEESVQEEQREDRIVYDRNAFETRERLKARTPEDQHYDPFQNLTVLNSGIMKEVPDFLSAAESSKQDEESTTKAGGFLDDLETDEFYGENTDPMSASILINPGYTEAEEKEAVENFHNLIRSEESFSETMSKITSLSSEERKQAEDASERRIQAAEIQEFSHQSPEDEYEEYRRINGIPKAPPYQKVSVEEKEEEDVSSDQKETVQEKKNQDEPEKKKKAKAFPKRNKDIPSVVQEETETVTEEAEPEFEETETEFGEEIQDAEITPEDYSKGENDEEEELDDFLLSLINAAPLNEVDWDNQESEEELEEEIPEPEEELEEEIPEPEEELEEDVLEPEEELEEEIPETEIKKPKIEMIEETHKEKSESLIKRIMSGSLKETVAHILAAEDEPDAKASESPDVPESGAPSEKSSKKKPRELNIQINEPSGTQVHVRTEEVHLASDRKNLRDTQTVDLEEIKEGPKGVKVEVAVNHSASNSSVEVIRDTDGATVVKTIEANTGNQRTYSTEPGEPAQEAEKETSWNKNSIPVTRMTITDIFGAEARKYVARWDEEDQDQKEQESENEVNAPESVLDRSEDDQEPIEEISVGETEETEGDQWTEAESLENEETEENGSLTAADRMKEISTIIEIEESIDEEEEESETLDESEISEDLILEEEEESETADESETSEDLIDEEKEESETADESETSEDLIDEEEEESKTLDESETSEDLIDEEEEESETADESETSEDLIGEEEEKESSDDSDVMIFEIAEKSEISEESENPKEARVKRAGRVQIKEDSTSETDTEPEAEENDTDSEDEAESGKLFESLGRFRNRLAGVMGGEYEEDDEYYEVSEDDFDFDEDVVYDEEQRSDDLESEEDIPHRKSSSESPLVGILRLIIIILVIAIVIEFGIIGIKLFAPDSQGAVLINRIESSITGEDSSQSAKSELPGTEVTGISEL